MILKSCRDGTQRHARASRPSAPPAGRTTRRHGYAGLRDASPSGPRISAGVPAGRAALKRALRGVSPACTPSHARDTSESSVSCCHDMRPYQRTLRRRWADHRRFVRPLNASFASGDRTRLSQLNFRGRHCKSSVATLSMPPLSTHTTHQPTPTTAAATAPHFGAVSLAGSWPACARPPPWPRATPPPRPGRSVPPSRRLRAKASEQARQRSTS